MSFSALKKRKTPTHGEFDDNCVKDQIIKIVQAEEETVISIMIQSSFRPPGMVSGHFRMRVNEKSRRKNPGSMEI
jgi:hypothetical protein